MQKIIFFNPFFIVLSFFIPISVFCFFVSPDTFSIWEQAKYYGGRDLIFILTSMFSFLTGMLFYTPKKHFANTDLSFPTLRKISWFFKLSYYLTVFGYVFWFTVAIMRGLNPNLLVNFFLGSNGAVWAIKQSYFKTVPGISTFTQFGMATIILGKIKLIFCNYMPIPPSQTVKKTQRRLTIVIFLGLIRAFFLSERLAVLELLVPYLVLSFPKLNLRDEKKRKFKNSIAIALMGFIFVIIFVSFEYFRSWTYYSKVLNSGPIIFGLIRLLGYYLTALNNGALAFQHIDINVGIPYFSLHWFWKLPILKEVLPKHCFPEFYSGLLAKFANPEFNNLSGFFGLIIDYGILSFLLWFFLGFVTRKIYSSYLNKSMEGMLFYPIILLSLTELPRIFYLTTSRVFPSIVMLLLTYGLLRVDKRRKFSQIG